MKNIVVTGANRGIGNEIAKQLAKKGHHIILVTRDEAKGKVVLNQFKWNDLNNVALFMGDMSSSKSLEALSKELHQNYDRVDVLINNAAIYEDGNYQTSNVPISLIEKTMRTNLLGPIELTQHLIPLLEKSEDPRIINVSSGMGAFDSLSGGYPSYRLSKTALNAFTANLASEFPSFKITAVCPGWVKTDMGGAGANRHVEKGAETPVWLAESNDVQSGKFYRDKTIIPW